MEKTLTQDWYQSLLDDVKSTLTEAVFNSRWTLIEGYHAVGKRLREDGDKVTITELVQTCAVDLGVSHRKLWYAVQFYDKFPDLNKLPDGKNVSWSKIRTRYLVSSNGEKTELEPSSEPRCPTCGQPWKGGDKYVK